MYTAGGCIYVNRQAITTTISSKLKGQRSREREIMVRDLKRQSFSAQKEITEKEEALVCRYKDFEFVVFSHLVG